MKKLTKLSAALVLAAAVAAPALAAPETYRHRQHHTFPRFSYSHFGYSTQLSRFDKTTGTVVLDKAAKTGDGRHRDRHQVGGYRLRDLQRAHPGRGFPRHRQVPDRHLQVDQGRLRRRQAGGHRRQPDDEGRDPAGDADRDLLPAMPHPMLKKDAIGANANTVIKRSRVQRRQVRAERGRRGDDHHRHSRPSSSNLIATGCGASARRSSPIPTGRQTCSNCDPRTTRPGQLRLAAITTRSRSAATTTRQHDGLLRPAGHQRRPVSPGRWLRHARPPRHGDLLLRARRRAGSTRTAWATAPSSGPATCR